MTDAKNPRGVEAISDYRVLETFGDASLVEVRLHTGKRNQIRIQAAVRGHALLGERQYTDGPSTRIGGPSEKRRALRIRVRHSMRTGSRFAHPVDGRKLTFEAPLPDDLLTCYRRLRGRA